MNCLDCVYKPAGVASREATAPLCNWHLRRFYDSRGCRPRPPLPTVASPTV